MSRAVRRFVRSGGVSLFVLERAVSIPPSLLPGGGNVGVLMIDRNGLAASREGTELLLQLLGLGATLFAVWGAMAQEIGVEFDLLAFEREPGLGAGPVSVAYGSGAPEVAMADFFDVLQPIAEFRPLSSRMVMIVGQAPPSLLPMLREQFDFGP